MNINVEAIVAEAKAVAAQTTKDFLTKYGDNDLCGFAWVDVYVKGSTKLGRAFLKNGFRKAYGGGLQIWNPSESYTQSISAKEAGAEAFAKVLRARIPGIKAYSGSKLD